MNPPDRDPRAPLDRVTDAWRQAHQAQPPPPPSPHFDATVLAAIRAQPQAPASPEADLRLVWRFAAVACLAAGLAAALAISSQAHDLTAIAWDLGTAVGGDWPALF